ncbi:hypothetical protein SteCoe_1067 [Stentor coeruleus]|uniref:Uncharacterized protein n=1 Tax=Stentor coeruleus TaxID=5963 RepID=A0A1R2D2I1_9CILI|nr:hypothetical protein SteCoe_1067 [Stentor coeruleus]
MESFTKISEIFENSTSSLNIPFSIDIQVAHLNKLVYLLSKPNNILEISITGQNFDAAKLRILSSILEVKGDLKRLVLSNNKIKDPDGIEYLCLGIKNSLIEYLDLSNNKISDDSVDFIADMIENSNLAAINLDYNLISKGTLAQIVSKSEKLQYLSINSNPLTYEFVSAILNGLILNKSLKSLHIKDIKLEGPAPIKENSSGQLTKKECVILKLAYILRQSTISTLSIDIDPNAKIQLEELEKTLLKYNSKLINLISEGIDWKNVPYKSSLSGIAKALKANNWIYKNSSLPKEKQSIPSSDIEELVLLKLQVPKGEQSECFLSNYERNELNEFMIKTERKNGSAYCSISSSPRSSDEKRVSKRVYSLPMAYSAETPQFTTLIKGMSFTPEKSADIEDISSIDYEERKYLLTKAREDKFLDEMRKMMIRMEKNFNDQLEIQESKIKNVEEKAETALKNVVDGTGKLTERKSYSGGEGNDHKNSWSNLSRAEKHIPPQTKKERDIIMRLESVEEELKSHKETFEKIILLMEDQKIYLQDSIKEKSTKIDIEILEKNISKINHRMNFNTLEIENFHKDISRLQYQNKQIETLSQEFSKLKDQEAKKSSEFLASFENFTKELEKKFSLFENRVKSSSLAEQTNEKVVKKLSNSKLNCEITGFNKGPMLNIDISKAVNNTNASIEEVKKRLSTERAKSPLSGADFFPGEAETLVMSAIMEKAKNTKNKALCKSSSAHRSNTPLLGFKSKVKHLNHGDIPSAQLQETLRKRGITYSSKGALTERRK